MKKQDGFSLIELLIVVVILGIIVAISVPNLIASRRAANESSAQASIRVLHGAQATYLVTQGNGNYAPDIAALHSSNLVDPQLGSGVKSGFKFETYKTDRVINVNPATLTLGAIPNILTYPLQSGARKFCIASDGGLRASTTSLALNVTKDGDCTAANYPTQIE